MNVIDPDLLEAGGERMKSLEDMYQHVLARYGGQNTQLAIWIQKVIMEFGKDVDRSSEYYQMAQLLVCEMVMKIRQFKSVSWQKVMAEA